MILKVSLTEVPMKGWGIIVYGFVSHDLEEVCATNVGIISVAHHLMVSDDFRELSMFHQCGYGTELNKYIYHFWESWALNLSLQPKFNLLEKFGQTLAELLKCSYDLRSYEDISNDCVTIWRAA